MSKKSKKSQHTVTVKDTPTETAPKNKRQTILSVRRLLSNQKLVFRTQNQKTLYKLINENDVTFCTGPAGCGKTYITVHYALQKLAEKYSKYKGIIITKPLVEAEGEKIGFLPGNIKEKTDPFMMSFHYNIEQIINKNRMENLITEDVIKVIPLAYMRGLTLADYIVILDEAQNATPEQIKMFLTRMGENSKFIVLGDLHQTDRKDVNGLDDSIKRFVGLEKVGLSMFTNMDIVRHPLISSLLERYEDGFVLSSDSAEMTISQWLTENGYPIHYKQTNVEYSWRNKS